MGGVCKCRCDVSPGGRHPKELNYWDSGEAIPSMLDSVGGKIISKAQASSGTCGDGLCLIRHKSFAFQADYLGGIWTIYNFLLTTN